MGASTIILSGTNTYTGATSATAGTLRLSSAGALGNGTLNSSSLTVSGSAILDLFGSTLTAAVPLNLNSTASANDVGSLHNSSGGSTATYSGAVTLQAATIVVGGGASTGGNITLTGAITGNSKNINKNGLGTLTLSNSGSVSLGQLQVNRGSILVDSGTTLNVTNIEIGTGNSVGGGLTLSGGNVTSAGTARFGQGSGTASGSLTLNSGVLTVPALTKGSLTFNANFNGGTLKASTSTASFFDVATSAKVQAGGAVIDDGGFLITIAQPLIHDTALAATPDGGLTKSGTGTLTLSGVNTYTGNTTVSAGTLELAATTGSLKFVPTTNGVSNKITGTGAVTLKGVFNIDLTGATATVGNAWTLVDVGTLTETFDASFTVTGFTENANVWTKPDGANLWTFNEATGVLTYSASSSYTAWIDANGAGLSDKSATGDPDNDGITNLLEFVLNGNPGTSDPAILPSLAVTATDYEFTYSRRDDSLSPETTQTFQYSTNLSTWTSIVVPATSGTVDAATVTVTNGSPTDSVKVSIPKSAVAPETKIFGRLQVTR